MKRRKPTPAELDLIARVRRREPPRSDKDAKAMLKLMKSPRGEAAFLRRPDVIAVLGARRIADMIDGIRLKVNKKTIVAPSGAIAEAAKDSKEPFPVPAYGSDDPATTTMPLARHPVRDSADQVGTRRRTPRPAMKMEDRCDGIELCVNGAPKDLSIFHWPSSNSAQAFQVLAAHKQIADMQGVRPKIRVEQCRLASEDVGGVG